MWIRIRNTGTQHVSRTHLLDPAQHEWLEYEVEPGHLFLVHPGPGSLRVPLNVLAEPFLNRKILDFLKESATVLKQYSPFLTYCWGLQLKVWRQHDTLFGLFDC
jgi:hypothetical protein